MLGSDHQVVLVVPEVHRLPALQQQATAAGQAPLLTQLGVAAAPYQQFVLEGPPQMIAKPGVESNFILQSSANRGLYLLEGSPQMIAMRGEESKCTLHSAANRGLYLLEGPPQMTAKPASALHSVPQAAAPAVQQLALPASALQMVAVGSTQAPTMAAIVSLELMQAAAKELQSSSTKPSVLQLVP